MLIMGFYLYEVQKQTKLLEFRIMVTLRWEDIVTGRKQACGGFLGLRETVIFHFLH